MTKNLHFPLEVYKIIKEKCEKNKIKFLTTAFGEKSLEFISNLNLDYLKIPSGEITNLNYLKKISTLKKKIILSSGMATLGEIESALSILLSEGLTRDQITILHCNTEYPTPFEDVNLKAMLSIKSAFGVNVGYSDHTPGIEVSIAAVAVGATIIEKHFTLDRSGGGPDDSFSMEPIELSELCGAVKTAWSALGTVDYDPKLSELGSVKFRRSLYAVKDIAEGEVFTEQNIRSIRPGFGIAPKFFPDILGSKAKFSIKRATRLTPEAIDYPFKNHKPKGIL
jgi:N,N'-diacetyllegionaminate synthase